MSNEGVSGHQRGSNGYFCCRHCAEDAIHDVETHGHVVPCNTCDSPSLMLRERAEAAEATVARVEKFYESLVVLGNLPIEKRPDGLTASVEACATLAQDLRVALDGAS